MWRKTSHTRSQAGRVLRSLEGATKIGAKRLSDTLLFPFGKRNFGGLKMLFHGALVSKSLPLCGATVPSSGQVGAMTFTSFFRNPVTKIYFGLRTSCSSWVVSVFVWIMT